MEFKEEQILDDIVTTNTSGINQTLRKVLDMVTEGKLDGQFTKDNEIDYSDFNSLNSEERGAAIIERRNLELAAHTVNPDSIKYGDLFTRAIDAGDKIKALTVYKNGNNFYFAGGEGPDVEEARVNSKYNALIESHKDGAGMPSTKINADTFEIRELFINAGIEWNEIEDDIVNKFVNEDKDIFRGS